jgi:hypothetical protein
MRLAALLLILLAAPAMAQTETPTPTDTPTQTPTPTQTYAAPPTPYCQGAKLTGELRTTSRTVANSVEVALIEATSASKSIVLHRLCISTAGATIVTLKYEQPATATQVFNFAAAGAECFDVAGKCVPDGLDLLVSQTQNVSTQITATYSEQ